MMKDLFKTVICNAIYCEVEDTFGEVAATVVSENVIDVIKGEDYLDSKNYNGLTRKVKKRVRRRVRR